VTASERGKPRSDRSPTTSPDGSRRSDSRPTRLRTCPSPQSTGRDRRLPVDGRTSARHRSVKTSPMALSEFFRNDHVQGLTEDRGSTVTEQFLGSLAPRLDHPRSVHNEYGRPIIHGGADHPRRNCAVWRSDLLAATGGCGRGQYGAYPGRSGTRQLRTSRTPTMKWSQ
jgi:hypothetical protein